VYANTLTALTALRTELGLIRLATDASYLHEKTKQISLSKLPFH